MAEDEKGISIKRILVMSLLVIIVAGGVSFFTFNILMSESEELNEEQRGPEIGPVYEAGDFLVNLSDPHSRRMLRASIVFEMDQRGLAEEIERRKPQIRDQIIVILRKKTAEELQENEGIGKLKKEIVKELNYILNDGQLLQIYFTEFVVQ